MFDIFGSVKGLLKFSTIQTDTVWFRMHYKATAAILMGISVLITARQYLGDPIDCIVNGVPQEVMDTYCWIHSTFTLPERVSDETGLEVAQPGVANPSEEEIRYHTYYQWVCFFTFFQALAFYIPRIIWKAFEGGKLKMLALEMTNPLMEEDAKEDRIGLLCEYMSHHRKTHNHYAWKYIFCELLNLVNVICQIFLTNAFVGGEFTKFGVDVIRFSNDMSNNRTDPMALVFPKVTKCTFHKFGPSGTVQKLDGLCVLPVNIVNEKVMVFLWFWFLLLCVITGIGLILVLITYVSSSIRLFLLKSKSGTLDPKVVEEVCEKWNTLGDWFLLYQLGCNMDSLIFADFMTTLRESNSK